MGKLGTLVFTLVLMMGAATAGIFAQGNMQEMQGMSHADDSSTGFDYRATVLADVKDAEKKFVGLAQAIPPDKYTWRPGEGVRSVSEVFLHIASANFGMPGMLGAAPAEGFNRQGFEKSTTDKDKVIEQLNKSFAYLELAIGNADVQKHTKMFGGRDANGGDVLLFIVTDLHEHLGQMIAYARINGVVPPWTAVRAASKPGL